MAKLRKYTAEELDEIGRMYQVVGAVFRLHIPDESKMCKGCSSNKAWPCRTAVEFLTAHEAH